MVIFYFYFSKCVFLTVFLRREILCSHHWLISWSIFTFLKVHSFYFEHHSKKHEKSTSINTVLPDSDSQSSLFGWMWFPVKNDDNDIDRLFLPLLFMSHSLWSILLSNLLPLFLPLLFLHQRGFIFLSFQFFFGIFFYPFYSFLWLSLSSSSCFAVTKSKKRLSSKESVTPSTTL